MRLPPLSFVVAIAVWIGSTTSAKAADFDFWYAHGGQVGAAVESLCRGFNASQRQHHVHCMFQGSYEQTMQKVVAAYRAGQQPAVVEIYDIGTLDMVLSGAIYPVSRLMSDAGYRVDWTDYHDAVRRYYGDRTGLPYSLPFNVSTQVLYADRQKLKAAGIDHIPQTWEAFETAMEKLKASGVACPAVTDFAPWQMLEQTSASQGEPIATLGNGRSGLDARYIFNTGTHRRFMNDVMRWRNRRLLIDAAETRAGDQASAFATGECVMSIESTSAWSSIAASKRVDVEVGMTPVYAGTQRHNTVIGGASLWVLKGHDTSVYQAVAAFFDYLRRPGEQAAFALRTGYLPVTHAAEHLLTTPGERYGATPLSILVGLASLDASRNNIEGAGTRLGFMPQFRLAWQAEVQKAIAGDETMDQALDRAKARGDQLLRQFRDMYAGVPSP